MRELLTGHGRVDAADVRQEGDLGKFDGERGGLDHLVLEDLGTLGRVVEGIDVEVTEIDDRASRSEVVDESLCLIGEDVVEEVVLEVLSGQGLSVCALDGKGFSA